MLYIVGICGSMAYEVNKQYGKGMPYCNLMNIIQLASETTTGNFAHKVATIRGLCRRNIDFLKDNMGFLVWIIVILTIIYVGMLNGCENFYEKALVSIIYFSIFVAIAFFTKSDLVCNMHMKKENLEKYIL